MGRNKKFAAIMAGILAAVMILSLILGLVAGAASAATSSEIQDHIDELKKEYGSIDALIKDLEEKLAANTNELKDMLDRKSGIDSQINLLYQQIDVVQQQVSALNLLIADKQEELDLAQARLDKLQEEYKARIRVMEEQGDLSYWSVIFKASSFSDLLDRLSMVVEIANSDQKRMEKLQAAADEVQQARAKLAEEKAVLEQSKKSLADTEAVLLSKRSEADELLQAMVAKGDEYKEHMEQAEAAEKDLMNQLAQANKDLEDQKLKEWLATSVPPTTTSPAGTGTVTNGIVWYRPTINYRVTSRFGPRTHPVTGQPGTFHEGIDLGAASGTPIYATRAGRVTNATTHWSAGNYVYINHGDGFGTIYMHMTRYVVKIGDYVTAGQIIGYVGSTGSSTGPHLHFGIARNGVYVDPEFYINF